MMMPALSPVRVASIGTHVLAGSTAIIAGYIALFASKGARLHRRSGMVFVYAMIAMSLMGATMALVWNVAASSNAPVGFLTAYLVITGLTTVKPPSGMRWLDRTLMSVAALIAVELFAFGSVAWASPRHMLHGAPAFPFFIFGIVALLSSVGDWRMIRRGGVAALRGAPRLTRHLWRMSFAMLVAVFSLFLGQAKLIPKEHRNFALLSIPPIVVIAVLLYWLWRVRVRRSVRGLIMSSPAGIALATHLGTTPAREAVR